MKLLPSREYLLDTFSYLPTFWVALEQGLTDILTFNCGRRPNVTERDIMAMVLNRFDWIAA